MARVIVQVMPKAEVLDPQGQAVVRTLGRIGMAGVTDVRQGKLFEIEVDDSVTDADLDTIASTLLSNPALEDYRVLRERP